MRCRTPEERSNIQFGHVLPKHPVQIAAVEAIRQILETRQRRASLIGLIVILHRRLKIGTKRGIWVGHAGLHELH